MSFLFVAAGQSKNLHAKRKIVVISIISNSGASCVGGSIFARSLNVDFWGVKACNISLDDCEAERTTIWPG